MYKEMLTTIFNHYRTPKRLSRLLGVYTGVEPPGSKVDEMGVNIVSKLVPYMKLMLGLVAFVQEASPI
jgi:hypothetical protein